MTTKTVTIPIAQATAEQLRQFATDVLGMTIHPLAKAETIRAKIAQVYDKDVIEVADAAPAGPAAPSPMAALPTTVDEIAALPPEQRDKHYVTVVINKGDRPEEQQPVSLSVNGRMMWVERGKPQAIRWPYFHALSNATRKVYHPTDEKGNMTVEEVPSYPFSVRGISRVAA